MTIKLLTGDACDVLATMPSDSIDCVVTSPPYLGQRRYTDDDREIGSEAGVAEYVDTLAGVFDELRRVLRSGGTAWLNIGDKSNGSGGAGGDWSGPKRKRHTDGGGPTRFFDGQYPDRSFLDVPGAVVRELLRRGWRLRLPIIWDKTREAPEDLTHVARPRWQHETIYMLAPDAGRTRFFPDRLTETGSIWRFPPSATKSGHLAPFPGELVRRCILPTTDVGDEVLDCFMGSGTTIAVAAELGRNATGVDLDERNIARARNLCGMFMLGSS